MSYIQVLDAKFNTEELIQGLDEVLQLCQWHSDHNQIGLTHSLDPSSEQAWYDSVGSLVFAWGPDPYDENGQLKRKQVIKTELQFVHVVKEFRNTIFNQVISTLSNSYILGRVRLMRLRPKTVMSWHTDGEPRLHVPIITNDGSFLLIEETSNHLKADGSAYFVDTTKHHTAVNAGKTERIHLVACVLGKR